MTYKYRIYRMDFRKKIITMEKNVQVKLFL